MTTNLKVAFLGPLGTYTHQAAHGIFGSSAIYCEKETIKDVFNSLSEECPTAVIPVENSIFGPVTETYDLFRLPKAGQNLYIARETSIPILHCLIVLEGVKLSDIKTVMSHEQALGQCRDFLAQNLPNASYVTTSSTAAAAEALLSPSREGHDPSQCAAICSEMMTTIHPALEILYKGIQNTQNNSTRFFCLSTTLLSKLTPPPPVKISTTKQALIRMCTTPARKTMTSELLIALNLSITRIDRRPSLSTIPFHDTYLVEVQQASTQEAPEPDSMGAWISIIQDGIKRVEDIQGRASLIGVWWLSSGG